MHKFETRNSKHKAGLVFLLILIILRFLTLYGSINSNSQMKQYGTIINDSYLYYDTNIDIIVVSFMFICLIISVIRLIRWKPKYMILDEKNMRFEAKNNEEVIIPFSEIKAIKYHSSKFKTSQGSFKFPIQDVKNLSQFLLILKSKLNDSFSPKEMKVIENRIIISQYFSFWYKAIIPQILFLILLILINFHINFNNLSINSQIVLFFCGIIIWGFVELLRFIDFSNKFNFESTNEPSKKRTWTIYGFGIIFWFLVILSTILVY